MGRACVGGSQILQLCNQLNRAQTNKLGIASRNLGSVSAFDRRVGA